MTIVENAKLIFIWNMEILKIHVWTQQVVELVSFPINKKWVSFFKKWIAYVSNNNLQSLLNLVCQKCKYNCKECVWDISKEIEVCSICQPGYYLYTNQANNN